MQHTDRILIGIVGAVVALLAVAFGLALKQPKPAYQADDSPEGVAHNYLLALRQGDMARAYGYLSPHLVGYPDSLERFTSDIAGCGWCFGQDDLGSTVTVQPAKVTGQRADLSVQVGTFHEGGLFGSSESTDHFNMALERRDGVWRLLRSERYWIDCWDNPTPCMERDPNFVRPPHVGR